MTTISLPFPPASLSGHAKGGWRAEAAETKKHREWASLVTRAAGPPTPAAGDIHIHITFVPPDRRSDRGNMPNRCKAYLDGIADALGVNDRRFLPRYSFAPPAKPGCVIVEIEDAAPQSLSIESALAPLQAIDRFRGRE